MIQISAPFISACQLATLRDGSLTPCNCTIWHYLPGRSRCFPYVFGCFGEKLIYVDSTYHESNPSPKAKTCVEKTSRNTNKSCQPKINKSVVCVCVFFHRFGATNLFLLGCPDSKLHRTFPGKSPLVGPLRPPRIQDDDHLLQVLTKVRMESFLDGKGNWGNWPVFCFVRRFRRTRCILVDLL